MWALQIGLDQELACFIQVKIILRYYISLACDKELLTPTAEVNSVTKCEASPFAGAQSKLNHAIGSYARSWGWMHAVHNPNCKGAHGWIADAF
jgi:hypothetical protein